MATEQTSGRPGGAVAEVKDKGEELVSRAQEQVSTKAHELGGAGKFPGSGATRPALDTGRRASAGDGERPSVRSRAASQ